METVAILVPVAEDLNILLLKDMPSVPLRFVGIAIGIIGDIVFVMAVIRMRDSWRAGVSETDQTELVTDVIYRISRNPAFLGFDMMYIGILCMYFNWSLLAISAFAVLMIHLQIVKVEKTFLLCTFGNDYLKYTMQVNRHFGRR